MWPVLYQAPPPSQFAANTYGLLILTAFVLAFGLALSRSRRIGVTLERMIPVYAAAAAGGLLGARVLYGLAVDLPTALQGGQVSACSGLAFYGGLAGGGLAVIFVARLTDLPGWKLLDALAPALVLGLGVGRMGCFFAGCCHGAPVELADPTALLPDGALKGQIWVSGSFPFLATEFHPGGVSRILFEPLYPTQLWSMAAGLGLAGVLTALWPLRRFDGQIAGLMLLIEPVLRFVIEIFRADHRGYLFSFLVSEETAAWLPGLGSAGEDLVGTSEGLVQVGLTTSQGFGLAMMILGAAILILRRGAGVEPEVALVDEDLA